MNTTIARNTVWKDPITFYSNILKYNKGSARVHNNLAMAYSDKENFSKAIEHYEFAIAMSDVYPQTRYNLARAYIRKGEYQKALANLNRSLELKPDFIYSLKLKEQLLNFLKNQ